MDSPNTKESQTFALIGAAGYIAPRHLQAIHDTGNRLVAAVDPHDSVGILDRYFPETAFFTEIERFDRFLEKNRRDNSVPNVEWVSICTPNYLHDAHVRLALRVGANAICEKPLVINPWNLDALAELEQESGQRIHTVLQLRLHPGLLSLKQELASRPQTSRADICLTYITSRGRWYDRSWKGSEEKSGGVVMNIGIHFFDALLWLFGPVESSEVHLAQPNKAAGRLELESASVRWFLSVDADDLPVECRKLGQSAFRSIKIDGQEIDFTTGFEDLHTALYRETLAGNGFGIVDARSSIELVHGIRHTVAELPSDSSIRHPQLS
ncbi:MAG: Gfo/Idh/MocA family oxidoreductase [Planctomycetota bacterium]|nr:Gfo/Idh/MocA family oxidoreductase [Planctomycetota bacterium]